MMHEDEFKPMMENYRLLRKEGIEFPPRDKSQKFMIQFKGVVSPVLENIDDIASFLLKFYKLEND